MSAEQVTVDPNHPITLSMNVVQANLVLKGLGKMPAEESFDLICAVRDQIMAQVTSKGPEGECGSS